MRESKSLGLEDLTGKLCGNPICENVIAPGRKPSAIYCSDRCRLQAWVLSCTVETLLNQDQKKGAFMSRPEWIEGIQTHKDKPDVEKDKPYARMMLITPELTREWLAKCVNQRPLKKGWVDQLAAYIVDGKWELNGEALKFNRSGTLIDGQHRLSAIIRSGVAVYSLVCFDVPDEAVVTIDTGRTRRPVDILSMRGESNSKILAAILRWLYIYDHEKFWSALPDGPSHGDLVLTLDAHPEAREAVDVAHRASKKFKRALPASLAGAFWCVFSRLSISDANVFFDCLLDGRNSGHVILSPVVVLRERLISEITARRKMPSVELRVLVVKGWNAFRRKEQIKNLRFISTGKKAEQFPTIN